MVAIAAPLAAPLMGPGAAAALGGLVVGAGALLRELMLRDNLSPQFYDFRRSQDLENIGGPTIRLSDTEIILRLLEDAIKTPVNFPSPPNLPEILGPWLQNIYDFWISKPEQSWNLLNSRTLDAPGPGQGTWEMGPADVLTFTYDWSLTYTYPLGNGNCSSGASGDPREENFPNQITETHKNVQRFKVTMQDVTLNRVCGDANIPPTQQASRRLMTITQNGVDYVTDNKADTGEETVTGTRSPRVQVAKARALSIERDGVEQLVPIPRFPVPGIDASPGERPAEAAPAPATQPTTFTTYVTFPQAQPTEEPATQTVPTVVPFFPAYLPSAPPVPSELTNFGQPQPVPVTQTSPTDHVIQTGDQTLTIPVAGASPNPVLVANEIGRIEQKAGNLLRGLGNNGGLLDKLPEILLLLQALAALFEQDLPAKEFTLEGVCEEPLEDGKQPSTTVILPPEKYAERLLSLGDVVPDLLQAHLGYKTPTCGSTKPPLEGQWITTRWISDEKMDHSGRRLRKLLRYRSKSTRDLGQLSAYWRAFTWEAGSICVRHVGAWWGDPQVWASTEEEGKRVLRFAATEAGIDPDQVGEWRASSSRSPRYGMSGTMRIQKFEGFPWVARRDGADWPNVLGV